MIVSEVFVHIRIRTNAGQKLPDFKADIALALLFFIVVIVLPLGFFAVQLDSAGRTAKREFGVLASRYVDDFRNKWVEGGVPADEPLLGTGDIQSLAELANSYTVVKNIRLLPMTKQSLVRLVGAIALPWSRSCSRCFPWARLSNDSPSWCFDQSQLRMCYSV